jgi:hypothetical protein
MTSTESSESWHCIRKYISFSIHARDRDLTGIENTKAYNGIGAKNKNTGGE